MQSTPQNLDLDEISKTIGKIKDVQKAHHIHVWSLDGQYNIMTIHIVIDKLKQFDDLEDIKKKVRKKLSTFGVNHTTIELEFI